ncbi:MAG: TldD/PmbA family protein, partial [Actinomycetota bacterium]|nr:TldD/PmbA family protein [Actinomycetota bacterium]
MLDESVIAKTLEAALRNGGDVAELFVERRRSAALRLDDSRIEDVTSGAEAGAGIRILSGDRATYAYTNVVTEAGLLEAAEAARAGAHGGSGSVTDLRRVEPG